MKWAVMLGTSVGRLMIYVHKEIWSMALTSIQVEG